MQYFYIINGDKFIYKFTTSEAVDDINLEFLAQKAAKSYYRENDEVDFPINITFYDSDDITKANELAKFSVDVVFEPIFYATMG